jgi:alpha-ribazole phosphatase
MSLPTHWWWVRHAPVPGAPGRLFGQLDVSCDTSDIDTFRILAAVLPQDAVWIVSSLARTRETMQAIAAAGTRLPDPIEEPALNEQNFGLWQGLSWSEMQADDPEVYTAFWQDPVRSAPPEGESYAAHLARARAAIERLTEHFAGRTVVCVSHGGTIRAAVATALGLDADTALALVVDHLSITRLSYVETRLSRGMGAAWRVQGINCPCRWIRQETPC